MTIRAARCRRVLVYHTGALGDFITLEPLLRACRETMPGVHLSYLGQAAYGRLGQAAGQVDAVLDIDRALFASLYTGSPAPPLRALLRGFDGALVFADDDSPVSGALRAAGIDTLHTQPPFPRERMHVVDYHLRLLCPEPLPERLRSPRFQVPVPEEDGRYTSPPIVIHWGSGSSRKNWPLERFQRVAARLGQRGYRVVWPIGPAEQRQEGPMGVRRLSLVELACLLRRCRLYLGNDTGVTHLAAATGCPTVALFGPTDPHVWAPRGPSVSLLRSVSGRMGDIAESTVLAAVWNALGERGE